MSSSVSVIIPSFNTRPEHLALTLSSALRQTYGDKEIILVDDGSRIPFSGLRYSAQFSTEQITWIQLPQNIGVAAARNAGASVATGRFLAFLDAGDWWELNKLDCQLSQVEALPNCGLIYCSAILHHNGRVRFLQATSSEFAYRELLIRQPITGSASAVLMPKTVFDALGGFYTGIDLPEDRDLWLRVARDYSISYVPDALVHLSWDPQSRSRDPIKKTGTYKAFLSRHEFEIRRHGFWRQSNAHFHIVIAKKFFLAWRPIRGILHLSFALLWSPNFVFFGAVKRIKRRLFRD